MPLTALGFSLIASLLVRWVSHRDSLRAPRITAMAIAMLLVFPLLSLLPKLAILPASSETMKITGSTFAWHWLWLAGATLLSVRILASGMKIGRWKRRSQLLEVIPVAGRKVELRSHAAIKTPIASGIVSPIVFVPPSWSEWPIGVREMVLTHELAHHRRRDPLWRLLGALACALHWFNPLVWWLVRRHSTLSEFACDAMVVREGIRPQSYASLLCDFASNNPTPQPAVAMAERSSLGARVSRLMSPAGSISSTLSIALGAIVLIAAVATAVLRRAETEPSTVPIEEVRLRLSADPFPGNR